MAPAPPPPPSSNIPLFATNKSNSTASNIPNTSALLKSIEKGTKLKKIITNDRSAPIISSKGNSTATNQKPHNSSTSEKFNSNKSSIGLNGLFSNGFPALRSTNNPKENAGSAIMKKSTNNYVEKVCSTISKNNEKASEIRHDNNFAPSVDYHANKQEEKPEAPIKTQVRNDLKPCRSEVSFPFNDDKYLPSPKKFSDCKKTFLSSIFKKDSHVSQEDIDAFTKSLKTKLKSATEDENFEECVRLKSKLKLFQNIEERIKSGEKINSKDLPK